MHGALLFSEALAGGTIHFHPAGWDLPCGGGNAAARSLTHFRSSLPTLLLLHFQLLLSLHPLLFRFMQSTLKPVFLGTLMISRVIHDGLAAQLLCRTSASSNLW